VQNPELAQCGLPSCGAISKWAGCKTHKHLYVGRHQAGRPTKVHPTVTTDRSASLRSGSDYVSYISSHACMPCLGKVTPPRRLLIICNPLLPSTLLGG
jgi:hypothetical protein